MKKNYVILLVSFTMVFFSIETYAADFFNSTSMLKAKSTVPAPTEDFYTMISLPYTPVDSVDMSDDTKAPTMYITQFSTSYPTIGYKFTLEETSTVTVNAVSNSINANSLALGISENVILDSFSALEAQSQISANLAAGDYYFVLFTNAVYGKVKLSITADVSTKVENTEKDQLLVSGEKGAVIVSGLSNESSVSIYTATGALYKKLTTSASDEKIEVQNKGMYIVNVNGISKKVIVM